MRRELGSDRTASRHLTWQKLLQGLSLYALLGWIYIAGNSISHPATLHLGLTHFASWPSERDFGLGCFAASAVCNFGHRYLRGGTSTQAVIK